MSKYKNKKTIVDGITFDSKKEANRYVELKILERAGVIKNLQRQIRFILVPAQREIIIDGFKRKEGRVIEREVSYKADFVYIDTKTGKKVVEDTKGFRTADYIIKRKLMRHIHGIEIKEV